MTDRRFNSYREACEFAKTLAEWKIRHGLQRDGAGWIVKYAGEPQAPSSSNEDRMGQETSRPRSPPTRENQHFKEQTASLERVLQDFREREAELLESISIYEDRNRRLRAKNKDLLKNIEDLKEEVKSLNMTIKDYENNIKSKVDDEVNEERLNLSDQWTALQMEKTQLNQSRREYESRSHELALLKRAYSERFGEAEVKSVEVGFEHTFCGACSGEGGVRGSCPNCGGSGFLKKARCKETVQIKDN